MKRNRAVWGWAFYDWANSAFATTVMAGFFPVFFKSYWSWGADVNTSTAQLGLGNSAASLTVALLAPLLGAIADRGSARKRLLLFFAYFGVVATAALALVARGSWQAAILVYALAIFGFSGANIFYDALLPAVADEKRVDRVSGLGYAMGYLGGGLLFALNVLMVTRPQLFGIVATDPEQARETAVKASFLSVALWWGGFSLLTALWVKEPGRGLPARSGSAVFSGWRQLAGTLRKVRSLRTVSLFLAAYWLYIDGVDTIIRMAVDYGLSLGFEAGDLVLALLITQFVGFPCALLFARLGERWGVRNCIFVAIGVYMLITVWGISMTRKAEFYGLAVLIGTVQGGIQALSRSFYSRLIPPGQAGEFFGFYNMLGKFGAIVGPALVGFVGLAVKRWLMPHPASPEQAAALEQLAARCGIGSILILFLLGALLLARVNEEQGRLEAAASRKS
ncbi:MAG: MFS transporter [bacterium]